MLCSKHAIFVPDDRFYDLTLRALYVLGSEEIFAVGLIVDISTTFLICDLSCLAEAKIRILLLIFDSRCRCIPPA